MKERTERVSDVGQPTPWMEKPEIEAKLHAYSSSYPLLLPLSCPNELPLHTPASDKLTASNEMATSVVSLTMEVSAQAHLFAH